MHDVQFSAISFRSGWSALEHRKNQLNSETPTKPTCCFIIFDFSNMTMHRRSSWESLCCNGHLMISCQWGHVGMIPEVSEQSSVIGMPWKNQLKPGWDTNAWEVHIMFYPCLYIERVHADSTIRTWFKFTINSINLLISSYPWHPWSLVLFHLENKDMDDDTLPSSLFGSTKKLCIRSNIRSLQRSKFAKAMPWQATSKTGCPRSHSQLGFA